MLAHDAARKAREGFLGIAMLQTNVLVYIKKEPKPSEGSRSLRYPS